MRYVMCFFPWIGIVIGALCVGWAALADILAVGAPLRNVILMLIPVAVSGGIPVSYTHLGQEQGAAFLQQQTGERVKACFCTGCRQTKEQGSGEKRYPSAGTDCCGFYGAVHNTGIQRP